MYLMFDHLNLRYQCSVQVVMLTRMSDCWVGEKESSRTVGERDFRSSCHFYRSNNYRREDSQ